MEGRDMTRRDVTKGAVLISTLLLVACVAFAQNSSYGSQDSSQTTSSTSTQSAGNETLRGCLSKEGSDYYLTMLGANQERYEITGNTEKLAAHVGHEISVTGSVQNTGSMMGSNKGMMGSNNGMMNTPSTGTIALEKFHHISATCPK
jgi:hypothetical protein